MNDFLRYKFAATIWSFAVVRKGISQNEREKEAQPIGVEHVGYQEPSGKMRGPQLTQFCFLSYFLMGPLYLS